MSGRIAVKSPARVRRESRRPSSPAKAGRPAFVQWAFLLAAITVAAYLPSFRSGFIWDDDLHVTQNAITRPDGLYLTWLTTHQPNYWPVTWTAFWAEWRLFGTNPAGYHVVNVLLHALNAVLVWQVLRRLAVPGAWGAALLFALHPVNVEAAAWITQLKTLLSMSLYLGSLLCFLRFEEEEEPAAYAAALLLFPVALLTKPSVVMLPVVLLLCAWWQRDTITRRDLIRSLPFFALAAAMSLTEIWFQNNRSMAGVVVRTDGFLPRLAGAGWVIWFYLGKALFPVNLSFIYPRWHIDAGAIASWIPGVALAGVGAAAWWKRHAWGRPLLFALGYFAVTLFPVLGFFNIFYMRYSFVADHWQYVAIVAPVALVAGTVAYQIQRLPEGSRGAAGRGVLCVAAAVFFVMTWVHQGTFRDIETLYRDTIRRNEGAVLAHANLAGHLYRTGRVDEAIASYGRALALDPQDPESHAGLGNALFDRGRLEEALQHYGSALPLMPAADRFKVHFEMAETYARMGRRQEAIAQFEQVLRLRPDLVPARHRLAQLRGGR